MLMQVWNISLPVQSWLQHRKIAALGRVCLELNWTATRGSWRYSTTHIHAQCHVKLFCSVETAWFTLSSLWQKVAPKLQIWNPLTTDTRTLMYRMHLDQFTLLKSIYKFLSDPRLFCCFVHIKYYCIEMAKKEKKEIEVKHGITLLTVFEWFYIQTHGFHFRVLSIGQ